MRVFGHHTRFNIETGVFPLKERKGRATLDMPSLKKKEHLSIQILNNPPENEEKTSIFQERNKKKKEFSRGDTYNANINNRGKKRCSDIRGKNEEYLGKGSKVCCDLKKIKNEKHMIT